MISNTVAQDTFTVRTINFPISFDGTAKPSTVYTPYLNGVDCSSMVKPFGKRLGGEIKSDDTGTVRLNLYYEFPFEANYAYENVESDTSKKNTILGTDKPSQSGNHHETKLLFELRNAVQTLQYHLPFKIFVVAGHTNRSEHHWG